MNTPEQKDRISFSKERFNVPCPDLLSLQFESFNRLFQLGSLGEIQKKEGLYNIFNENFPISDIKGNFTLEFLGYHIEAPYYSPRECIEQGLTYEAPLKVNFRLTCHDQDKPSVVEEEVYLVDMPCITPQGSFIFKGIERVLISHLERSYGVFFSQNKHISGADLYAARIVPYRGTWIEISVDLSNVMYAYLDRRKKMPVTLLLRAIGYGTDRDILNLFDLVDEVKVNQKELNNCIGRVLAEKIVQTWAEEYVEEDTGEVISVPRTEVILDRGTVIEKEEIALLLESEQKTVYLQKENITNTNFGFIYNTLQKDETNSEKEAIAHIYYQFRNTEASDEQAAKEFLQQILFSNKRAFLGNVGRYCMNKKLGLSIPDDMLLLTVEDIVATIKVFPALMTGKRMVEDIDSMVNRIVRLSGDLLEQTLNRSFRLAVHHIKEVLNARNNEELKPSDLINGHYISSSINSFLGTSASSQYMEQTNPLSELEHKRRVTKVSEGMSRERIGFEMRDVHPSQYGKGCPVNTPEGINIGLVAAIAVRAMLNPMGFLQTPYKRVEDGRVLLDEGVHYLTAEEEEKEVIAQITNEVDEQGRLTSPKLKARRGQGEFVEVTPKDVTYIDCSYDLTLSVSASMIPFFETNDANRTTMGANMQRQAVPLLKTEAPIVGTGKEKQIVKDSRSIPIAIEPGEVVYVDAAKIIVRRDVEKEIEDVLFQERDRVYPITKLTATNKGTCINLRPIVQKGQRVEKGDCLCEGYATHQGELALGKNLRVAFMPWKGYNFEDAIVVSERVVEEDIFTSLHIEKFTLDLYNTKLGQEEFTADIPNVSDEAIQDLDENGVVRVGKEVKEGDILVGKITPQSNLNLSTENKLLQAIFGEKAYNVKDSSLRAPASFKGTVIATEILSRTPKGTKKQNKEEVAQLVAETNRRLTELRAKAINKMLRLLGTQKLKGICAIGGEILLSEGEEISREVLDKKIFLIKPQKHLKQYISLLHIERFDWSTDESINKRVELLAKSLKKELHHILSTYKRKRRAVEVGDPLPLGVLQQVRVYVAKKRKLQVGDKLSGRYGNKGVVSKVVRKEDMPYHADGTPVDIVLNPLGVPSRMNIGQLKETVLGWAGHQMGVSYAVPVFQSPSMEQISAELEKAGVPAFGRTTLYDGFTGEPFEQKVTCGVIYMLKLDHLVEDKMHARATGPYALITQQPLGGRARKGGQRLGEMEVWALQGYGAAYTLRECLTIKSDDIIGRRKAFEAIYKGTNLPEPQMPEAFRILVHELSGLGLKLTFR